MGLCKECPKKDKIRVDGDGNPKSKLWIIGWAPGPEEIKQGKPFVGPSGQLLMQTLHKFGVKREDVYVNNVQRCFEAPGSSPNTKVLSHCVKYVWGMLKKYQPDVVIVCGQVAASYLLFLSQNEEKIYEYRGFPFHRKFGGKKITFIPTFHPAKILRERQAQKAHLRFFVQDVGYAVHILTNPIKDHTIAPDSFLIPTSVDEARQLLAKLLINKLPVAFDFETTSLRPYHGKLISIALSNGILTFAIDLEKFGNYLKDDLISFFKSDLVKIAHNLQFEVEWIYQKYNVLLNPPYEDTMLLAHSLRPHRVGLKDLAHSFLKVDDWDIEVGGKAAEVDREKLLIYNCYDAYYTFKLYEHLKQVFDSSFPQGSRWRFTYDNWVRDLPVYVAKAQVDGVLVDKEFLKELEVKYLKELKPTLKALYSFVTTEDELAQISEFDLLPGNDVYDKLVCVYSALEKSEYYKVSKKILGKIFNFRSVKQLAQLLQDRFGVSLPKTEKGNFSVDDHVLDDLLATSNDKLKEFIILLRKLRDILKNLKTYVINIYDLIDENGRIHTQYKLFGARTGRFSSSQPNLQNWPKRKNKFARNVFTVPKGKIFLKVDYSSLEVRVLQMYAQDPVLGRYLAGGGDMHFDTAKMLYGNEQKALEERSHAKNGIVFPVFYGAGFKTVREAFPELPEKQVKKVYDWLRSTFSKIIEWQQKVWDFYCNYGYVDSFHGYRRWMPMNFNMVINHPIQSFAAFLMWSAWIDLIKQGYDVPLYIHDEIGLVIDATPHAIKQAVSDLKKYLLERPFQCLKKAPLDMEIELGYSYGNLKTFNWREVLKMPDSALADEIKKLKKGAD